MNSNHPKIGSVHPSMVRSSLLVGMILLACISSFSAYFIVSRRIAANAGTASSEAALEYGADGSSAESLVGLPVDDTVELTPWDGAGRVTVLVMGLDYRDWSQGDGPARTDSMMLLTMDPLTNSAGILSIPRDLWVTIPGFENGRINTAYFLGESYQVPGGGPALAARTVEQLLGIPIHYYAQVDFSSFVRFVDEIGGVKIDIPDPIKVDIIGRPHPITLKAGVQTLYGEYALAYARARNSQGGDFDRSQRQQQVVLAIRDQVLSHNLVPLLVTKGPALYQELSSGMRTNLGLDEMIKLAVFAQQIPRENIARAAISTQHVLLGESPDKQKILIPLPEKIRLVRDELFGTTGALGPLTPGSALERMQAEAAALSLQNGSLTTGLAALTGDLLAAQGAHVAETINADTQYAQTVLIDYTGNPHTIQYLAEFLQVQQNQILMEYDPTSTVDVVVKLGIDWGTTQQP